MIPLHEASPCDVMSPPHEHGTNGVPSSQRFLTEPLITNSSFEAVLHEELHRGPDGVWNVTAAAWWTIERKQSQ